MGVDRRDYIVIGANIGAEHHNDEWYEMDESPLDKYDGSTTPGEIAYIYDGMSGDYFVVGEVIQCDPEGYDGLKMLELGFDGDTNEKHLRSAARVHKHILDNFGISVNPKLIVFTHWH